MLGAALGVALSRNFLESQAAGYAAKVKRRHARPLTVTHQYCILKSERGPNLEGGGVMLPGVGEQGCGRAGRETESCAPRYCERTAPSQPAARSSCSRSNQ
jgi:hypothetical protein